MAPHADLASLNAAELDPSPHEAIASLRIGTRGSPLALWQAECVRDLIRSHHGDLDTEIVTIRTSGEAFPDRDLQSIGIGVFTREIDDATLSGDVDIAVHSLKDLPTELPEGLCVVAVPRRDSPLDAWVSPGGFDLEKLPHKARIGTSSPRRRAQLLARRPDFEFVALRGNVETRIRKIAEERLHGIVLAQAGLERLGLHSHISSLIPTEWVLPAVGQGALAVVAREDRKDIADRMRAIDDSEVRPGVEAERAFLRTLRGGCQIPAGALATRTAEEGLELEGVLAAPDGQRIFRHRLRGSIADGVAMGEALAEDLLKRGGADIVRAIRGADDA